LEILALEKDTASGQVVDGRAMQYRSVMQVRFNSSGSKFNIILAR
jgi:hypothetical protein